MHVDSGIKSERKGAVNAAYTMFPGCFFQTFQHQMGVSKNRGTPKWIVYNGKPY